MASSFVTDDQIRQLFEHAGVDPLTEAGGESEFERVRRIRDEVRSGQRTLSNVVDAIGGIAKRNPGTTTTTQPIAPGGSGYGIDNDPTATSGQVDPNAGQVRYGGAPSPQPSDVTRQGNLEEQFSAAGGNLFDTMGLPRELRNIYIRAFLELGDPTRALIKMRESGAYKTYFPGNMREDGTVRYSEAEYNSQRDGVNEALVEFGFAPGSLDFGNLVRLGVDAQEAVTAARQAFALTEPGADSSPLGQAFLQAFSQSGSQVQAFESLRGSSLYQQLLPGMRRDDGTLRFGNEQEYYAYRRGWRREFLTRDLDPTFFEGRGLFVANVEGELSINEVSSRLELIEDQVEQNVAEVSEFYATNYAGAPPPAGMREAMFASAIDPTVTQDIVERRVKASQIGGEAKLQGFARSVERAEQLARAGISQQQARGLFGSAARSLPGLSATTARFNRGGTNLDQFEDAFALGDATQGQRIERALREEDSSFSSRADVRRDNTGLSGLRVR